MLKESDIIETAPQMPGFLLQLHIAEYNALTTRITYWITLQYSIAPATIAALVLVAATYRLFTAAIAVWATITIINACFSSYLYISFEILETVLYIECELAPRVRTVISKGIYWQCEKFRNRNAEYPSSAVYLTAFISTGISCVGILFRRQSLSSADFVGAFFNIILSMFILFMAKAIVRVQNNLWACLKESSLIATPEGESG